MEGRALDHVEDGSKQEAWLSAFLGRAAGRRRIAVLTDNFLNSYGHAPHDEVFEAARECGRGLICLVGLLRENPPMQNLTFDLAQSFCVDGIFVQSLGNIVGVDDTVDYCARYEPLPICTTTVPWKAHASILVDNEPGIRDGVRHLVEVHGRRRIAFVRGPEVSAEAELRFRVYREVLAEYGVPFDPLLVSSPGIFVVQDGVKAMRLLLDERKVSFDAVTCVNDMAAMGVMQELSARGIVIPDQVAVLGFDDIGVSPYLESPLTTVRQPVREQARRAWSVLLAHVAGELPSQTITLPTQLVVRESCGCTAYWLGAGGVETSPAVTAANRDFYEALWADLSGGGSFLPRLEGAVKAAAGRGDDVSSYQKIVTLLQKGALDLFGARRDEWRRVNAQLHEARVRVSNASERMPAMQQLRLEDLFHRLSRLDRSLTAAEDLAALARAAGAHLPEFGITSVYVCTYEGDAVPAEWARLVVAWDAKRELALPPDGVRFRCREFLPEGFLSNDPSVYIAYSLARDGTNFGYVVWERGAPEGVVYDALRTQFEAALGRLGLLERVVEEAARREATHRERLQMEIEVARGIQTGIEPRSPKVTGLDIAAKLVPAGGPTRDYYDVIPVEDGGWISMGGVTGQGLSTGLSMLMLQSVVGGLVRSRPSALPSEVLPFVDAVLLGDTRRRLLADGRISQTLCRYDRRGRLVITGAYAHVLVCRAATRRTEWVSSTVQPPSSALDTTCLLQTGDLVVLHSDGLRDAYGLPFGITHIEAAVQRLHREPVERIRDALVGEAKAWKATQGTDIAIVVARQVGEAAIVGDTR
jgi:sigma-B regulation protein RsbU (phosphoserine phosphatase)